MNEGMNQERQTIVTPEGDADRPATFEELSEATASLMSEYYHDGSMTEEMFKERVNTIAAQMDKLKKENKNDQPN